MLISVDIVIYEQFKALETIAALTAFSYANSHLERRRIGGRYDVKLASTRREPVISDIGLALPADKVLDNLSVPHTTIVVGSWQAEMAVERDGTIVQWLESAKRRSQRMAALCSGVFFLAKAGILDHRRVTTHWAVAPAMRKEFPAVRLETECIFVKDGPIWTSAGVSAGIDLALAMLEEDFGPEIALDVAKDLVVYLKRSGGEAQLSSYLVSQATQQPGIRMAQDWILANLDREVKIGDLARLVSMSVRNLNRCFRKETGTTPSAFLAHARIAAAKRMLEESDLPAKCIAARSGFRTYEAMRRAFKGEVGGAPLDYRARFKLEKRGVQTDVEWYQSIAPHLSSGRA
nr:helix-turn-helix domain-containing protein [Burkholderia ambifaria]